MSFEFLVWPFEGDCLMACIERRPRCSNVSADIVPTPLEKIASAIAIVLAIIGAITTLGKIQGWLTGFGSFGGGAMAGFLTAVALLVVIIGFLTDRCNPADGLGECMAGVVHNIVQDFSTFLENLFPFTAMHDRIDVIVKSGYWDKVEDAGAFVFCTEEDYPRRSEIIRCYYFTDRVCDAARGALIGASFGAVAGIAVGALAAAAIGCLTVILCIIALIVAALITAAFVLGGAAAGGHIAKGDDTTPSDNEGTAITVGDLITVNGNMLRRSHDNGANVLWWVESSSLSGRVSDSVPNNPFSYCDINDEFTNDACLPIVL